MSALPVTPWAGPALALLGAPLLQGIVTKVKAFFAGRRGPPLLQGYADLFKLLRKGAVFSETTTWLFRAGPVVSLAAVVGALVLNPAGGLPAPVRFGGDLFVLLALLALARFVTVLAALDTGSSFEGMGASREVFFSALAEPALFLAFAVMTRVTGSCCLSDMIAGIGPALAARHAPVLALLAVVIFLILLAENARIPVDDPLTHLELTMIHEVMVLDHGGPDLAMILYASALKFWLFAAWLSGLLFGGWPAGFFVGLPLVAVAVGVVESSLARLRLVRVPQFLLGAAALATVAVLLVVARG